MAKLTAPQVHNYIEMLHNLERGNWSGNCAYDKESFRILDTIMERIKALAPAYENGAREFWLRMPRGAIEDFADYQEWLDEGYVDNYDQFQEEWLAYFPEEEYWIQFGAVEEKDTGYKAIQLQHRIAIEVNPRLPDGFEHDIHEFMEWMLEAVDEVIGQVKAGTYNSYLSEHLPFRHRVGTIPRQHFWDALPGEKESFLEGLDESSVAEFVGLVRGQADGHLPKPLSTFTADEFYRCCSLGYAACGYDIEGLSPKEQYYRFADGRDEGLREIQANSPDAFSAWLHREERSGGHPWEVCRGGNSTHVDLYVLHESDGYTLVVRGSAYTRCVEAIKFFLALYRAGYPVIIRDGESLAARLEGTELVGIVPAGVIPRYCSHYFPGEEIISYINLPYEDMEQLLPHCIWKPIPELQLLEPEM